MPVPLPPPQEIREPYPRAAQDALFDTLSQLAQDIPLLALDRVNLLESEAQRDRILQLGFASALVRQRDVAYFYLPSVMSRPWLAEMSFPNACELARLLEPEPAMQLLWAIARKNPDVALRQTESYLDLAIGPQLFARAVHAAPDEAVSIAAGSSRSAGQFRDALKASDDASIRLLADLSQDRAIEAPRLRRVAILHQAIASGELSLRSAVQLAGNFPRYFATLAGMRIAASPEDSAFLDRALQNESLTFCVAFQQAGRALASDLAALAPRDLYLLLAYGRAEASEPLFAAALPRLRALAPILDRTRNLELRDFAAAAIAVHRLDAFIEIAGPEVLDRLARGIDQSDDRLQDAVTVAEVIDGAAAHPAGGRLASAIAAEYARAKQADDRQTQTLYGLLAARFVQSARSDPPVVNEIAEKYLPYLVAAGRFETASLFGPNRICVERHFFYDDDDGVESFASFLSAYERDPAWKIEEREGYVDIAGRGPDGRRVEIFANIPINAHLPANAARQDEAYKRQQAISAALQARGLVPAFLVHRGHSFWVEKSIRWVNSAAKLVFLGSCGGVANVHSVIERSRDAQVIATRGVGTTQLNDGILKSLNDWLLRGNPSIDWSAFWQAQKSQLGHNPMFRDYFAPDRDTASILLRAYFQSAE